MSLLKKLESISQDLNVTGYGNIQSLLVQLRVFEVDPPRLQAIWDRICREPSFSKVHFSPLSIKTDTALPCPVQVPKQAFEDIMGNLLRNAIQSSVEDGIRPVPVEMCVGEEVDPITGLEHVIVLVRDRSRKPLTVETLTSQEIEHGLGLTVDLISKYDGFLDVLPAEKGWTKSVEIKLPRGGREGGGREE